MLADRITAGEIVVPVAETYALADVVEAFRALDRPHAPGKIIILP
ncbi:zinc-binding dehydrogenase [Streptomyces niveiscabiei]